MDTTRLLLIVLLVCAAALVALPMTARAIRAAIDMWQPSRRSLQFTLRTMLLTVTIAAVGVFIAQGVARSTDPWDDMTYVIPTGTPNLPFDHEQWRVPEHGNTNRLLMVNDILANHLRTGWTRQQVVDLLGETDVGDGPNRKTYVLTQIKYGESAFGSLRVTFDSNDCVKKYELAVIHLTI